MFRIAAAAAEPFEHAPTDEVSESTIGKLGSVAAAAVAAAAAAAPL
jgi:hypothetical protein